MLVKSRVAWAGHPRNAIVDVDPNSPDVQALLASGRLTRVDDPELERAFHPDALVGQFAPHPDTQTDPDDPAHDTGVELPADSDVE